MPDTQDPPAQPSRGRRPASRGLTAVLAVLATLAALTLPAVTAGAARAAAAGNPEPAVAPGLQQWTGGTGTLQLTWASRVVVAPGPDTLALLRDAYTFSGDLAEISGLRPLVMVGDQAQPGDISVDDTATGIAAQGYQLGIGDTVSINGVDATGAFYAEQSIEQMLSAAPDHRTLPQGTASDWPEYGYRGIMLDLGRHYYAPDFVSDVIRDAAWRKLDEVHLHLTEAQAFRLQLPDLPGLAPADQSYSPDQVAMWVAEAERYHVTLVPEVDVPAHATAITAYDPALKWTCDSMGGQSGFTLDVTNPATTTFVTTVINDLAAEFPNSPVIHLGGDEYPGLASQRACPELVNYAAANHFASTEDVFTSWQNQIAQVVTGLGRRPEIWNWWDVVGGADVPPSQQFVVDAWTGSPDSYLSAGYDTVSSPDTTLYVTAGAPPGYERTDQGYLYSSWQPEQNPHLTGYELSVWSDGAITQPDTYFQWFFQRPLEAMAARVWGGARQADIFGYENLVDAIGEPPDLQQDAPRRGDTTPLQGTPYGNGTPYAPGTGYANAFDGNVATYVDDTQPDGDYMGIDLGAGNASRVVEVRYAPRRAQTSRMVGGVFQGCTQGPDEGCVTIATIPYTPSGYEWLKLPVTDHTAYRWLQYTSPNGGFGNVSEIQFLAAASGDASITASSGGTLTPLDWHDSITAALTNSGGDTLRDSHVSILITNTADHTRVAVPDADIRLPELRAGRTAWLRWRVPVPLDTEPGTYLVTTSAGYQSADGGWHTTTDSITVTVPAPVTASIGGNPVIAGPQGGTATLNLANASAATLRVRWTAAAPAGSGVTLSPASGVSTLEPGASTAVPITVTGSTPGVSSVPVSITAEGFGQSVNLPTLPLQVSVPYPTLAASFDNIGITDDSDPSPANLDGGFDGDGSAESAQALAAVGLTAGGTFSHDGLTFTWPSAAPDTADNTLADGQAITTNASGATLGLLATATYGPLTGVGTVVYSDGSTQQFSMTLPDWSSPPTGLAPGVDVAAAPSYRNYNGGPDVRPCAILGYTVPLAAGKTVAYVVLPTVGDTPNNGTPALHVFAIAVG